MKIDLGKSHTHLLCAAALGAAALVSTGANAQTVPAGSDDIVTQLGLSHLAQGGAADAGSDPFAAIGPHFLYAPADRHFPGPVIDARNNGGVGPIPEPASWLTMLCGFGLIGAALRRRAARPARA